VLVRFTSYRTIFLIFDEILVAGLSPPGGPCWPFLLLVVRTLDFRAILSNLGATCPDGRADNRRLKTSRWVLGWHQALLQPLTLRGRKPDVNGLDLRS
jgi:hypothetical protein